MGDYWTNAVRHPEDVGVGHIRRTITFDMVGAANGIPIGGLEAGAIPMQAEVTVITPFNGGTTNVLTLGIDGTPDGFVAAAGSAAGVAGYKPNLVGSLSGQPLARNTPVKAFFSSTGTPPTAGVAIVLLKFVNKREVEGQAFPNNP